MTKYLMSVILSCNLFLLSCSGNKTENKQQSKNNRLTEWKFVRLISLDSISPIGIVAQNNFLWVSDVANNQIVKINLDGKQLNSIKGFQRPMHLDIDKNKIYVPEYTSDTIQIWDNGTKTTLSIKEKPDGIGGVSVKGKTIAIADFYNNRIILQQDKKTTIIGKEGHDDGELYYPTDVQITNNLIYVADAYNNRVQVFDWEGNHKQIIGWNEHIKVATGLKVTENQVFIADFEGDRVLIYSLYGKLLQILNNNFNQPTDIEIVGNTMYVVNFKGKSITIFENK